MLISRQHFKRNGLIFAVIAALITSAVFVSLLAEQTAVVNQNVEDIEPDGNSQIHALIINEIMSSNGGAYADEDGQSTDWVELYNGTSHAINLTNFGLSDTANETKWIFPAVTIEAKRFLIINLSGVQMSGMNANFALKSSGGENLILRDATGMIVDQIQLPDLLSNWVLARNTTGEWVILDLATPGFENTLEGSVAYHDSIFKSGSLISITEVLPQNAGNFIGTLGLMPGFIEISNTGTVAVNLKNYALGDELNSPFQWHFPSVVLEPGKAIVVNTSNLNRKEGDLHADFTLSSVNGSVFLTDNTGHVIDRLDYTQVPNGFAIQRNNGITEISASISPGYPNTIEGITAYQKTLETPKGLIINEVMTRNVSFLRHNGANAYSWIELRNNSNVVIDLSEYRISKSANVLDSVTLPNLSLQPGTFILLMASGDALLSTSIYHHIDIKLSGDEAIYLFEGTQVQDCMFVAQTKIDMSYGRAQDHGFQYMNDPSPNAENNDGVRAVSLDAVSDLNSGIYAEDEIEVNLMGSGPIYYTTNGDTPTTSSPRYTTPIVLKKSSVIKAVTLESGKIPSNVVSFSFILNEGFTLPVVSLTIDKSDFKNVTTHPSDMTLEVPAHIEYYDGSDGFSIDCGFQLFGGSVRWLPKQSFAIKFKDEYGADRLNYPVFEKRDFSVFDTLILRSGSQDYNATYFRDILASSIMEESETVEVQAFTTVILYINGQYWGLYDFREKVDEDFIATHKNVDESSVNVVRVDNNVSAGTRVDYAKLLQYATNHDLSVPANYAVVESMLNIDSYIDFWIGELFTTNNDVINTRFYSSSEYDDGRFSMIFYDLDYAWYYPARPYFAFMTNPDGMSRLNVSTLLNRRLFASDLYRTRFLERLSLNLKTIWSEENVMAKLETLYTTLKPEIRRDFLRWGLNPDAWEGNVDFVRNFIRLRTPELLKEAKSFFHLTNAEYEFYFGGL